MTYPVKIEFKEYPSGSWADWSAYLVDAPTIDRRVESENEGEAGVIVFDNATVSFRYASGNPVYSAFSIDLSSKQRYLFRISAPKSNKTYIQLFEGIADFSTITWQDDQKIISFEIIDKLSAFDILTDNQTQRTSIGDGWRDRIPNVADHSTHVFWGSGQEDAWDSFGAYSDVSVIISRHGTAHTQAEHTEVCVRKGETIELQGIGTEKRKHLVLDSWLAPVPTTLQSWITGTIYNTTWVRLLDADISYVYFDNSYVDNRDSTLVAMYCFLSNYYNKPANYIDLNASVADSEGRYPLESFDALKIIEALATSVWDSVTIINRTGSLTYPINPEYYSLLVDASPLGEHPLDALKMLATSMRCYIYYSKAGELVIQSKSLLSTYGTTRTLGTTRIISLTRNYFWDKLADAVNVEIKSWLVDEYGNAMVGTASLTKQGLLGLGNIKPKNEIELSIFAPLTDPAPATQEDLDTLAAEEAVTGLDFYGERHSSFDMELHLDDNVLDWDLIDNLTLASIDTFFTSLRFDLAERTATLTPVEIDGHAYDLRQVVVTFSESNYNNASGTSSGGPQIIITSDYGEVITSLDALDDTAGILVQTGGATFAKRTITSLQESAPNHLTITNPAGTAGDINIIVNPLAEIQLAKLGIGVAKDSTYFLKVGDGSNLSVAWFQGNVKADGDVNIATGKSYKINDVARLNDTMVNLATGGAFKINSVERLTDSLVNLATGGAFKINSVDTLNATTLGSAVVNSSLTKVGTLTLGVWNATAINAPYINFNTTNLKNSSNALNTIQDIAVTSSPQWLNVTLTGVLDQQGTNDSKFGSQYIIPQSNYYTNLGTLQKKYLTLHAAELWVETLVAQNTIATIGGRVMVGPTTSLTRDLSTGATTVYVKHNEMASGDTFYMEADGKVEFMRCTSGPTLTGSEYYYSVTRNLDGSGANAWYAGDACFNTGNTGDGFIDIYSIQGIKSATQSGPSIVGSVRNSQTYNDWSEHWAVGNLKGVYGYSATTFGAAFGKYAADVNNITVDATNGIRFRNYTDVVASWAGDVITLGKIANSNNRLVLSSGAISFIYRNSGGSDATKISIDASGNATFSGSVTATAGNIGNWDIDGERIFKTNSGANFALYFSAGTDANSDNDKGIQIDLTYGSTPAAPNPKWISIGNIRGNNDGTTVWAGNKGIAIYDGGWYPLFEVSNARRILAGLSFDNEKIYVGSATAGFAFNKSATPFITGTSAKGFEVYDVSDPKMFLGKKDGHSLDWNITSANKLTMKGEIVGSAFATYGTLSSGTGGGILIQSNYIELCYADSTNHPPMIKLFGNKIAFGAWSDLGGAFSESTNLTHDTGELVYSGDFTVEGSLTVETSLSVTSAITIASKNVPKFHGVLSSNPTTNLGQGDTYATSGGAQYIYTGSSWWQYR
ncbi:MAG: hypothetical protein PHX51_07180 [Clostridia bacterium]|nr:hypothetical protein [Clostridia bacterium]